MAIWMDGKALAKKVREEVAEAAAEMTAKGHQPGLAVILVGEDPASQVYVRNKVRACEGCGLYSVKHTLPAESTTEEVIALVESLNRDDKVDGILVQLPLPKQIDRKAVLRSIAPEKDSDMLHPENLGELASGAKTLAPCTPSGILRMLDEYNIPISGKRCCVIGRSELVGRPVGMLLTGRDGTVTLCHSRTAELAEETRRADILVAAIGKPKFVTGDMIKPGAAVIDVGINRLEDGSLCGDVDFASAEPVAGHITPVPGGCGPMTIAMLLDNTIQLAKKRRNLK